MQFTLHCDFKQKIQKRHLGTMWILGSLKDVLENEAIQLDWNFRMSLIHDIVKVIRILLD